MKSVQFTSKFLNTSTSFASAYFEWTYCCVKWATKLVIESWIIPIICMERCIGLCERLFWTKKNHNNKNNAHTNIDTVCFSCLLGSFHYTQQIGTQIADYLCTALYIFFFSAYNGIHKFHFLCMHNINVQTRCEIHFFSEWMRLNSGYYEMKRARHIMR